MAGLTRIPTHYRLIDGAKSVPLSALPEEAWHKLTEGTAGQEKAGKYYDTVAYIRRCIDVRADSLLSIPWHISQQNGEDELWNSEEEEPPAELSFLVNLMDLLWLTEATLCMYPKAFWSIDANRLHTKKLVDWYAPQTIKDKWDKKAGLTHFERTLPGQDPIPLKLEEVVYFWLRNPFHETKPRSAPIEAAMAAGGVLFNVDQFAADFFERGAIKATILALAGNPPQQERERIKSLWGRLMKGIANAFGEMVISADSMEVHTVGEGIESLSNNSLTTEKREDIATAFGIPQGLVMSNETGARATAEQDDLHFYSKTMIPQARKIARPINRQLLNPLGYQFVWDWQEMDIFQEDENQRSQSLKNLVDAGFEVDLAAEVLGFDLTDEQWARLRTSEPEPQPAIVVSGQPALPGPVAQNGDTNGNGQAQPTPEVQNEIRQFRAWAKGKREPDPAKFKAYYLTDADKATILAELQVEDGAPQMRPFRPYETVRAR